MIFGVGTDIVKVKRIQRILDKNNGFSEKTFCPNEISYCRSQKKFAEHFAARFAAKEALFKAMGTGWSGELQYQEIEVIRDEFGKPELICTGAVQDFFTQNNISKVHISLSHVDSMAIAMVILETLLPS